MDFVRNAGNRHRSQKLHVIFPSDPFSIFLFFFPPRAREKAMKFQKYLSLRKYTVCKNIDGEKATLIKKRPFDPNAHGERGVRILR